MNDLYKKFNLYIEGLGDDESALRKKLLKISIFGASLCLIMMIIYFSFLSVDAMKKRAEIRTAREAESSLYVNNEYLKKRNNEYSENSSEKAEESIRENESKKISENKSFYASEKNKETSNNKSDIKKLEKSESVSLNEIESAIEEDMKFLNDRTVERAKSYADGKANNFSVKVLAEENIKIRNKYIDYLSENGGSQNLINTLTYYNDVDNALLKDLSEFNRDLLKNFTY